MPEAVLQELFTATFTVIVVCSLKSMCVPSFIVIGYCVSEFYCNVFPEAVFIVVLQELHSVPNCLHVLYDQSLRLLSYHQALLLYILLFLRYNVAKCIV